MSLPAAAKNTLRRLSTARPVFHSEADFQHAFAWQLRVDEPDLQIRLEYRPDPAIREKADIWIVTPAGQRIAVELKYLVRAAALTVRDERFHLRNQGAHDISRYDVVKDVTRVERWLAHDNADDGLTIVLSNDPGYWNRSTRDTIDRDFRLHDGGRLHGELRWAERAGSGTTRGRQAPLAVRHPHDVEWLDYSTVDDHGFRALILHPTPDG